jgi:flagellar hook-associated protein 2
VTTSSTSTSLGVSSLGGSTPLQITGLASGLDTNSIISELMSIAQQPVTALQNQQSGLQALNTNLTSIQSALQGLANNAQALSSTTLFSPTQTVNSSDSSLVAATAASGVGAVVGGYQIAVSQMATAAQATYSFSSQSSPNSVKISPSTSGTPGTAQTYNLAANATAQDLVNAVNADQSGSVWGTVVNGNIVFSDRTTGAPSAFTVSDSAGSMAQQGAAVAGTNAIFSINGTTQPSSPSNTINNAIPGVNLTLGGITTGMAGGGVNVSVSPPNLSTSSIQSALQTFVSSYNAVLDQVNAQLSQAPSKTDPTQGKLYGDPELTDLLSNMRQAMYSGGAGLPAGMASMLDIGVSTGATTGGSTPNPNAISGHLTIDTTKLAAAIQSNPAGVTAVLQNWSQSFSNMVNAVGEAGGTIDSRIQGDDSQLSNLSNQISTMQSGLTDKQAQLTQQFAALEAALSQNQSTSSWLTTQLASLPVA